jgi:short-subunit dehydrogenase
MASALVTGATAGIGESFVNLLAAKGYDLILVARDLPRLDAKAAQLRERFKIDVEVLSADLSIPAELRKVEVRLMDTANPVEVLINNAGFGIREGFLSSDVDQENQLLDVLVRAPMRLMHALLPGMRERNSGTIINVSSVSGWIAGGSYSAAKSYLTVLSESLHTELVDTNIRITALCPGFTHTEFHQRAKMKMSGLPGFMWLAADRVADDAWTASQAGKAVSIPGWQYGILATIARFGPRPLVRKLGMSVRRRQRGNGR